ncbi:MAG: hypothetical protein L0229_01910 [Blastocatellia bacterium]|nr:hypothetical protein [Blastocatellia bacterium]
MKDSRVIHLWDEARVTGRWFAKHMDPPAPREVEWDAYFLYGPDARWDKPLPSPLISWGRTIMGTRKKLETDIQPLLEGSNRQ